MPGYEHHAIEKKWQKFWSDNKVYRAQTSPGKPKYYALDMFPYPSGAGLHVGHPEGYTATDIISRYKRAQGFAVMHPMGWDAFGLPAEQYAIKQGVHPRTTTEKNIARFRDQLQAIGFSYDWDREVDTTDPTYYKWTQWIFLQLYDTWFDERQQKGRPIAELVEEFTTGQRPIPAIENRKSKIENWNSLSPTDQRTILAQYRLAYQAEVPVNWCPGLGTVLANEEVIDGKSEVGGFPVERRPMKQWMLRITAYAQRLIDGLDKLEWSDSLKEMQRNWIGRSEGAEVTFEIAPAPGVTELRRITVFTTRPDTLFGATYMVMAPEHAMVPALTTPEQKEKIEAYRKWTASRSERERQEDTRKTGEFTGSYAINPVNGNKIPIYISDYVLMGYGTGAIMAVPAHDERDHEFATKFNLPIIQVVAPVGGAPLERPITEAAFSEEGIAVNSPWIDGLPTQEAKKKISDMLQQKGVGKRHINFKIRDWLFSRQRYWGEPFPLVHLNDGTTVPINVSELPIKLPELEDFKPTGTIDPPLSKAPHWFNVNVRLKDGIATTATECGGPDSPPDCVPAKRELNTMPQWAGSCWYYLRYLDPHNDKCFIDPAIEKYWLHNGVDLYIGGVEHAVLHLLYARFWHKVLFDRGLVSCDEPFRRLVNQGLILGEMEYTAFKNASGAWLSATQVDAATDAILDDKGRPTSAQAVRVKLDETQIEKKGEGFVLKESPAIRIDARSFKMSKSRGNVVNPDDVIKDYGADSLRMFEMFMGPLEQVKPWSTAGVEGVYRFLQRVWRNFIDTDTDALKVITLGQNGKWLDAAGKELAADQQAIAQKDADTIDRITHRLIKRITEDIERTSLNTPIAAMMAFNNDLGKLTYIPQSIALTFMRLLEPFAPHFAEEMYQRLTAIGGKIALSVTQLPWPAFDPAKLVEATIDVPVQINGKLKARVSVANDAAEDAVFAAVLSNPDVQKALAGKEPKKKIYVKGRMVNLVV